MTLVSLFATLVFVFQGLPPAQGQVSTIEGLVAKSGSGEGLAQSQITLVRTNRPGVARPGQTRTLSPPTSAMTDAEGRFSIRDVAAGTYRVFAVRNGYVSQEYGQRAPNRPGTLLEVPPNQAMKNVDFRLSPAGTITGRVTSALGEPLPRMEVQLLRSTYDENGKRQMASVTSDLTDDRGEYRLFWVPPGRYFLSTMPAPTLLDQLGAMQGFLGTNAAAADGAMAAIMGQFTGNQAVVNSGYALTYYPATADAARATSVEVQPGSELASIDIRMDKPQGSSRLRGRVLDTKTGLAPRNTTIMLMPHDLEAGGAPKTGVYDPATGTFEIRNVAPGSYVLVSMGGNMMGFLAAMMGDVAGEPGAAPPTNAPAPEIAQMSLEVRGDIDDIVLKVSSGIPIQGLATVSGLGSLASLPGFAQLRVGLQSGSGEDAMDGAFSLPSPIADDGKFTVRPTPGTYRIQVTGLPPNTFVKSAHLGASDLLEGDTTIGDSTTGTIQLEIGTNPGEIEGSIVDKDMKPVKALQAVLIPEKRSRRDLYKTATSGDDGHFTLNGITPGNYKVFAWEDLEPNAFYDPDVLRRYEAQGKAIVVPESGKVQVELKPIQN